MPAHESLSSGRASLEAAQTYLDIGFSVIPLRPDSKRSAVAWRQYQDHPPTPPCLREWFEAAGYTGVGIVTGRVSRLAVLDFDDPAHYDAFREQHPNLAKTYTVRTRRGYHLYFRLPKRTLLKSRKTHGLDLKVDGGYVVAPPTRIGDHTYAPIGPAPVLTASISDQRDILAFFEALPPRQVTAAVEAAAPPGTSADRSTLTVEMARGLYSQLALESGRNNALFDVACQCRDANWAADKVLHILGAAHIRQPAPVGHRPETDADRLTEARHTVASAYSRPARRRTPATEHPANSTLPNSVREALLGRQDGTAILRTLEGLRLHGVTQFTEAKAKATLTGVVGGHSIRLAVLSGVFSPPAPPQPLCTAANKSTSLSTNAGVDRRSKPKLNRGRPQKHYQVPTVAALCERLGVAPTPGDPITLADLHSVKTYRAALHREHLRRRPGRYSRKLFSNRLKRSITTVRRYERLAEVQVTPTFERTDLGWDNINGLPHDTEHVGGGVFLEDEDGKRYPLKFGLACKLLKAGRRLGVMVQKVNHYAVEPNTPLPPDFQTQIQQRGPDGEALDAYWKVVHGHRDAAEVASARRPMAGTDAPAEPQPAPTRRRGVRLATPAAPAAPTPAARPSSRQVVYWGDRIQAAVNARATSAEGHISRQNAQQLVSRYGVEATRTGLRILGRRDDLDAPAGFLIAVVRSFCVRATNFHTKIVQ